MLRWYFTQRNASIVTLKRSNVPIAIKQMNQTQWVTEYYLIVAIRWRRNRCILSAKVKFRIFRFFQQQKIFFLKPIFTNPPSRLQQLSHCQHFFANQRNWIFATVPLKWIVKLKRENHFKCKTVHTSKIAISERWTIDISKLLLLLQR